MKPTVVILTGPTASGKSDLSVRLAQLFPVEIVSADSLQVFRRLDIGTAKPTATMRVQVPHHLVDVLDPDQPATAYWYAMEARRIIDEIVGRGKTPIVVGGGGFYLRALEHPPQEMEFIPPSSLPTEEGYRLLKANDPKAAEKIHPNDRYRISRAVALLEKGYVPSDTWEKAEEQDAPFDLIWFALDHPRDQLYKAIDVRVERMFSDGLVEETRTVLTEFPNSRHRIEKSIGYHQALNLIEGRMARGDALKDAQQRSRNYAKRQLTWFRKEKRIRWLSKPNPEQEIIQTLSAAAAC